ncbi:MAG: hypothetical protein ACYSUD_22205 [Planctomycetota bacterium]
MAKHLALDGLRFFTALRSVQSWGLLTENDKSAFILLQTTIEKASRRESASKSSIY